MSEIMEILTTGNSARDQSTPSISDDDLLKAEEKLGFNFPPSYKEFISLGGLGELRINHRVLSPEEILDTLQYLPSDQYIPFADNGCGDLYCWPKTSKPEPPVLFVDHESREFSNESPSFAVWLKTNRF